MMNNIKSYWVSKTNRDRYIIGMIAALTISTILYYILISPLAQLFSKKKQEVQDKMQLFSWMKAQAPKLGVTQKKVESFNELDSISVMDKQFKAYSSVMTLSKNENGTIQVMFKQIDFNQLLTEILVLKNKYNISVNTIEVLKLDKPGLVQASINFQVE